MHYTSQLIIPTVYRIKHLLILPIDNFKPV
jgi:hypothetical protein